MKVERGKTRKEIEGGGKEGRSGSDVERIKSGGERKDVEGKEERRGNKVEKMKKGGETKKEEGN